MKKSVKKWLSGVCGFACLLCVSLGVRLTPNETDAATVGTLKSDAVIDEKYSLGMQFTIPEGDIVCDGITYPADTYYLKAPDGRVYEGRVHTLNDIGIYTVVYSAKNGATLITAEQTFVSIQANYQVSSNASSFSYVETLERDKNGGSGVQVSLVEGDTFTFHEPIDINETQEYFSFYPYDTYYDDTVVEQYPNGGYTYDRKANIYVIRLTDCYNPNNYIETEMAIITSNRKNIPYSYATYVRAGTGTGLKAAMNPRPEGSIGKNRKEVYVGDVRYEVYYGTDYGINGIWGSSEYLPACSFKFDAETNRLYFKYDTDWKLINDLDNVDVNDKSIFHGFTTGEVYLSVYANDYFLNTASTSIPTEFEVAQIGQYANETLNLGDECLDMKAPKLYIDAPYDLDVKRYAAKGESLTVFDAYATDVHLVGDVMTRVFYDYNTNNPTQVLMQDGQFTPTQEGDYSIVYTAKDTSGNVAEKVVTFTVVNKEKSIAFSTERLTSLQAGTICTLPEYTVESINDEEVKVSIYAVFEGDEENKAEIDATTREFLVEGVGTYEIRYVCQGVLAKTQESYTVQSVSAGNVRIDRTGTYLPKYLIKNARYTFDEVHAYRYDGKTPTEIQCTYYVSEDGGAEREIDYLDYKVEANSTVRFKYVSGSETVYSEAINVVDVGFGGSLKMQEYFVGDVSKTADASSIVFTSNKATGNTVMDFVNVLSMKAFSMTFKVAEAQNEFESFNVVFTDVYDENVSCTLRFFKKYNGMYFQVNDEKAIDLGFPFADSRYTTVSYVAATNTLEVAGGGVTAPVAIVPCPVQFTSGKMQLQLELENIDGTAGIELNNLCAHKLRSTARDRDDPFVVYNEKEMGERELGTIVTIQAPTVNDTLSPYLLKNVIVKCVLPSGDYATSLDGVSLNGTCRGDRAYQIKLDDYGVYGVEFTYSDQSGNTMSSSYAMNVSDRTAPTLEIENGYNETTVIKAAKGDTHTIADYSVDDNFGKDGLQSWVLVVSPLNEMIITDAGETLTLNQKGKWKICYYCHDAEFNAVMRYYYVDVE